MLGRELWAAYLQRHFVPPSIPPEIMNADADAVARLIWPLLSKFREKLKILISTRFDRGYDAEANAALWRMAEVGNLDPMDDCSAGAGRVLYERASWSIVALTIESEAGSDFMIPLPAHAPVEVQALAALLFCLGGPGTEFPPQWPDRSSPEDFPAFPADMPLRPQ